MCPAWLSRHFLLFQQRVVIIPLISRASGYRRIADISKASHDGCSSFNAECVSGHCSYIKSESSSFLLFHFQVSISPMGCLRLVGSFKLYVSFAEYSLFYRALLQKRHTIFRNVLIVATPAHLSTYLNIAWLVRVVCGLRLERHWPYFKSESWWLRLCE